MKPSVLNSSETEIVRELPIYGLNAQDVFDFFFSDDAPCSYFDFQKTMGDVNIQSNKWECPSHPSESHFAGPACQNNGSHNNKCQERCCTYETPTRCKIGPATATVTKRQRVTFSPHGSCKFKDCFVIESKTEMSNIPYSDCFRVEEKWIVEPLLTEGTDRCSVGVAVGGCTRRKNANKSKQCSLSVYAKVKMLKPCAFRGQIQKRSIDGIHEMAVAWHDKVTKLFPLAQTISGDRTQNPHRHVLISPLLDKDIDQTLDSSRNIKKRPPLLYKMWNNVLTNTSCYRGTSVMC